jgi:hypothetical protein
MSAGRQILINVSAVAFLLLELGHVLACLLGSLSASGFNDFMECFVDIMGHARGITTDVENSTYL